MLSANSDVGRFLSNLMGSARMKRHGPIAIALLAFLAVGPAAFGAEGRSGQPYYYPNSSDRDTRVFGTQQSYDSGSFRPREFPIGGAQGRTNGSGYTRAPQAPDAAGAAAWNGGAQGYWSEPRAVQPDQPMTQYRFRPRAEDKTKERDDSPRYRPDPDLARRSQRYWGVPGQEPSTYGGGPAVIFRPLRPEQEAMEKQAPPPAYPAAIPPWPGNQSWGGPGYGYPY